MGGKKRLTLGRHLGGSDENKLDSFQNSMVAERIHERFLFSTSGILIILNAYSVHKAIPGVLKKERIFRVSKIHELHGYH